MISKTDNNLLVGASKKTLDMPDDFFPYRSFRGRYFTGQHDELYVRCLYLKSYEAEELLIISMDLGDLGEIDKWQENLSGITGIPADHIFLSVTHNHGAPHVSDDYNQDVVDVEKTSEFGRNVWKSAESAVLDAVKSAVPATACYGTGSCDINVNRNFIRNGKSIMAPNPHGVSDKTVVVLKFDDLDGNTIAYFINYAVHGAVMFDTVSKHGGMLVTGDLPGETCRIIEKRHGNKAVAVFTSGAAGDQIPRYMSHRMVSDGRGSFTRQDAGESGWILLQVQAENLADEAMSAAAGAELMAHGVRIRAAQKKYQVPGQKKTEDPHNVPDNYVFEDEPPVTMPLGVFMIGTAAFVCIPGEPVSSLGRKIQDGLPLKKTVLVTHCNGSLSYISDDYGYEHLAFEAVVSHFKRGQGKKAIIEGAAELLGDLLDR